MNEEPKISDKRIEDYLHLYIGCEITDVMNERFGLSTLLDASFFAFILSSNHKEDFKLLLRPLSSITSHEFAEVCEIANWNKKEFDKEWFWSEWDSEFSAIEICPLQFVPIVKYLISKHFDLFGLIDEGLAIDSTKKS